VASGLFNVEIVGVGRRRKRATPKGGPSLPSYCLTGSAALHAAGSGSGTAPIRSCRTGCGCSCEQPQAGREDTLQTWDFSQPGLAWRPGAKCPAAKGIRLRLSALRRKNRYHSQAAASSPGNPARWLIHMVVRALCEIVGCRDRCLQSAMPVSFAVVGPTGTADTVSCGLRNKGSCANGLAGKVQHGPNVVPSVVPTARYTVNIHSATPLSHWNRWRFSTAPMMD